jgi:hypothetical protein
MEKHISLSAFESHASVFGSITSQTNDTLYGANMHTDLLSLVSQHRGRTQVESGWVRVLRIMCGIKKEEAKGG